jgi:alkylation response protein AidB-like acyl-CoA dehydrogenase
MAEYVAPVKDMQFVLKHVVGLDQVNQLPGWEEVTEDLVDPVLEEAAKMANEVLSPLNSTGDRTGAKYKDGVVTTPPGFKDAYKQYTAAGWNAVKGPAEFRGPGAAAAHRHADRGDVGRFEPRVQALPDAHTGRDRGVAPQGLGAPAEDVPREDGLRRVDRHHEPHRAAGRKRPLARAHEGTPQPDGSYKLKGTKIFITYGEHDYTENIIHLVLGRVEGAPEGVRGISLFVVPKFLVNADGSLGARNDVKCVSIEHKLGIHASPTAVLAFGEKDGAVGYLVGEANRGLEYMFIMMNAARLSVGLEGVAVAERAYQRALGWARERLQGKPVGVQGAKTSPIVQHPDVKRMLLTMKSVTEAMRALAYWTAAMLDRAKKHPDETERRRCQAMVDLLIPVVKGWSTENGIDIASLGIQVHGGMGFIEETGAAQHLRDARITTIYEGTTGIQANDLVGRKVGREEGRTAFALMQEMEKYVDVAPLRAATEWIVKTYGTNPAAVAAGSVYYLKLMGITCGGWLMARSARIAADLLAKGSPDQEFLRAKQATARFYADHILVQAPGLAATITKGAESVLEVEEALL